MTRHWTGPQDGDLDAEGKTTRDLPPTRWPYGPPEFHESCCCLFRGGAGAYCDCKASDASDSARPIARPRMKVWLEGQVGKRLLLRVGTRPNAPDFAIDRADDWYAGDTAEEIARAAVERHPELPRPLTVIVKDFTNDSWHTIAIP